MTLDELVRKETLSERTKNVCNSNFLFSLDDILEYYKSGASFREFRNAGVSVEMELKNVCKKYENYDDVGTEEFTEKEEFLPLNEKNIFISQKEFVTLYEKQSYGIKTIINNIIDNDISLKTYYKLTYNYDEAVFKSLRSVGVSKLKFLIQFHEKVKLIVLRNRENLDNELENIDSKIELVKIFDLDFEKSALFIKDDNQIKIFCLIDYLMKSKYFFNKKLMNGSDEILWFHHLHYHTDKQFETLEEIRSVLDHAVSRERVRQIRVKLLESFKDIFSQFCLISNKYLNHYEILASNDKYIFINEEIANRINFDENTNYTTLLIGKIMGLLLNSSYTVFGNELNILKETRSRTTANLNYLHIIENRTFMCLNWEQLIFDVEQRNNDRIEKSYSFKFSEYLEKFIIGSMDTEMLLTVKGVAEKIIYNEFGIRVIDNEINFEKNTIKLDWEYAYEFLQSQEPKQEGYHIETIYGGVLSKYPHFNSSSLQAAILREKDVIKPIGRTSSFILTEWENNFPDKIKGGDIREIVVEYLGKFDQPQKISEITKYVQQFRPNTYENSVNTNLYLDKSDIFVFYENTYIGLTQKVNKGEKKKRRVKNNIKLKHNILEFKKFIETNDRVPTKDENSILFELYEHYRVKSYRHRLKGINKALINSIDWEKLANKNPQLRIPVRRNVSYDSVYGLSPEDHVLEDHILNKSPSVQAHLIINLEPTILSEYQQFTAMQPLYTEEQIFIPIISDYGFKATFGNEANTLFLRRALQALIKSEVPITEVKFDKNTFEGITQDGRGGIFDLACTDKNGNHFIVEMQYGEAPNFVQRMKFYALHRFNSMVKKGKYDYESLARIYCVALLASDILLYSQSHTVANLRNEQGEIFDSQLTFITVELNKFKVQEDDCQTDLEKLIYTMKTIHTVTKPTQFPKFWDEEWLKIAIDELDSRKMTPDEKASLEILIARNAEAVKAESRKTKETEQRVQTAVVKKALSKGLDVETAADLADVSIDFVLSVQQQLH